MKDEILVTVWCRTYNHEKYINVCLQSLISQITNFKYEILVHDDASTDNTTSIIKGYEKKYPGIIKTIYQTENQYSKHINSAYIYMLPKTRGKYIALCEGDDFWISNDKLQKQIDFLESHPDYSLCGHAAYYANEDGSLQKDNFFRPYKISCEITMDKLLESWKMATNSLIYRKEARDPFLIPFQGDCKNGDYATTIYLGTKGKVYYIDELMSAYRVNSLGSLNWQWKQDYKKRENARLQFVEMLDRIDKYTEYQYQATIKKHKAQALYELYMGIEPRKLLSNKTLRVQLSTMQKLKVRLKIYFPWLYRLLQKISHG